MKAMNTYKKTILHYAAERSSIEDCEFFVEHGADVNSKDWECKTPLHYAVISCSFVIVKCLVRYGADVNCVNTWGKSALHYAAKSKSLKIVKYLVTHGACVNCKDSMNGTALHDATKLGSLEIVKYLVEHGADINPQDKRKSIPLHYAVRSNSLEVVIFLIENGADVNCEGWMDGVALHDAAKLDSLDIVRYLVEHGADVNCKDGESKTAVHFAAMSCSLNIVKYLFDHGAIKTCKDRKNRNALHYAVKSNSFEIVQYLLQHGADVNGKDWKNGTALHYAAKPGSLEFVTCLVDHGADINATDMENKTALHCAVRSGALEVAKYLVKQGVDVNTRDTSNRTALHFAVISNSVDIVKCLVQGGAEVTCENTHGGNTILFLACKNGDHLIVDYLLQGEAVKDIDGYDMDSVSPLRIACKLGNTAVVRTLIKFNVDIRRETSLKCQNSEIIRILKFELKKSLKHREKIRFLKSLVDKELTQVGYPLKLFSPNKTLLLGAGSMGTFVYVGILEDGTEVAVKRMLIQASQTAAENEKRILSLIDSSFVVSYRTFLKDDTFMYLIVDLCEETLREYVRTRSVQFLGLHGQRMVKEILTGLEFLHNQGILHRDLKPSNVLVDVNGHMRLTDFGLSRVLNEEETTFHTDPKGTNGWMGVEVIEAINHGGICDFKKKSDIQVAGMIAFFILTKGEHPFGEKVDRMRNIGRGNPVNLKKLKDRNARQFVALLISHKLTDRPYAHEAMNHSFLKQIVNYEPQPKLSLIDE
ncbi:uncharacterized protein LOC114533282 [Dendronephthya gigantea]|uniref:uncharacterized protein LOC114533282 n=1 Tax=Dendronephthya gigantea TaxID=151771 RepID=UPI001069AA6D|nr:uncharacterized protein LOC114533282 [Dendronephthya gigantea]